jgi:hypothetical protein
MGLHYVSDVGSTPVFRWLVVIILTLRFIFPSRFCISYNFGMRGPERSRVRFLPFSLIYNKKCQYNGKNHLKTGIHSTPETSCISNIPQKRGSFQHSVYTMFPPLSQTFRESFYCPMCMLVN